MAYVQFQLKVHCDNTNEDILTAISNPDNIIGIFARPNTVIGKDLPVKNPINIMISSGDSPRFIIERLDLILLDILYNETFINSVDEYDLFVKVWFERNSLLMNKWLRYADTIRSM